MYELSTKEFLYMFYTKLEMKLKRLVELSKKEHRTLDETKELFESKNKILEAFDILLLNAEDPEIKKMFETLATLIISTNPNHLEIAKNFCNETRSIS